MTISKLIGYAKVPNHLFQIFYLQKTNIGKVGSKILYLDENLYNKFKDEINYLFSTWDLVIVKRPPGKIQLIVGIILSIIMLFCKSNKKKLAFIPTHNLPLNFIKLRGGYCENILLEDGRNSYRDEKSNKLLYPGFFRRYLPYFTSIYDKSIQQVVLNPNLVIPACYNNKKHMNFSFALMLHDEVVQDVFINLLTRTRHPSDYKSYYILGLFQDNSKFVNVVNQIITDNPDALVHPHPRQDTHCVMQFSQNIHASILPAEYIKSFFNEDDIYIIGETSVAI